MAKNNYNEKWGRDDSKREDVQNRYTGNFVNTKNTEGIDPTLTKMLGDWSGRVGTSLEQQGGVVSMCAGCNRKIDNGIEYVNHQGKKFHKQCYNVDVQCGRCNKPVFGEVIQAIDKNWHPACFHCSRCNVKLTSAFIERNGDPYCSKCGNEPSMVKTTIVSKPAAEKNAEIQKRNDAAQELYQNAQKGKVVCVECARVIGADENGGLGFAWNGMNYHTTCFKCSKCHQSLQNKGVTSTDSGDLICEDCHSGTYKAKCVACLKPLDGKWITVGGHKYHSACFVCDKCRTPLDGGYIEKDGQKLHPACNTTPTLTKTPVPTTHHRGFTVDPRTGQKKYTSP